MSSNVLVLKRQQLHFRFYIINQIPGSPFNRAKLLNVGYVQASKDDPTMDCFVFHDVDLVLEDDRCLYSCDGNPNHYSVAIDKFRYRIPYKKIFGGIVQLDRKMFKAVNGFRYNLKLFIFLEKSFLAMSSGAGEVKTTTCTAES